MTKSTFIENLIVPRSAFNQMTNDYSTVGGRDDKYLEAVLGDFDRFCNVNQVFLSLWRTRK